ncbi:hypothetical protein C0J52_24794 [Blattella germanica]|nr:hypothetical protein C0J52_24794 [Blattella germanica]
MLYSEYSTWTIRTVESMKVVTNEIQYKDVWDFTVRLKMTEQNPIHFTFHTVHGENPDDNEDYYKPNMDKMESSIWLLTYLNIHLWRHV